MRGLAVVLALAACSGCSALYGFDYTVGADADAGDITDASVDGGVDASPDAGADGGLCAAGQLACDRDGGPTCVDPMTDPDDCGTCGVVCGDRDVCLGGVCQALVTVEGGDDHTCALGAVGTLYCWGENRDGQLGFEGRDRTTAGPVVFPPEAGPIVSVAVGGRHTCAVSEDGRLFCWGNDDRGQLGLGSLDLTGPTEVELEGDAVEVVAGSRHTCVRQADGEVLCFGDNAQGQLGIDTFAGSALPLPVVGFEAGEVQELSAGDRHTCARVVEDGATELRCWGDNRSGQLGNGDLVNRRVPWLVSLPAPPVRVATGAAHTCVITEAEEARELHCFGSSSAGQVGAGSYDPTPSPAPIPRFGTILADDVAEVVTGGFHTCATRADDSLYCWGSNRDGQLGNDELAIEPRPGPVGVAAHSIGAGQRTTCGVIDRRLHCWGGDGVGAVGVGTVLYRPTPTPVPALSDVSGVAVAAGYSCAIHGEERAASCFGTSGNAQLGGGRFEDSSSPVEVLSAGVVELAPGPRHACALTETEVGPEVLCWGSNSDGQLGQGSTELTLEPVAVPLPTDETPISVGSGLDFACAAVRLQDGGVGVDCWGENLEGQLAQGSVGPFLSSPQGAVQIPGSGETAQVRAGTGFACAHRGGEVACWGDGRMGQLGVEGLDRSVSPLANGVTAAGALDASGTAGCALQNDTMVCWGANPSGLLGTLDDPTFVPTPRSLPVDVMDVSVGSTHLCVLTVAGGVWCAGSNRYGELGDGTFVARSTLEEVELPGPATQVSAGSEHTCAVVSDTLHCWGHDGRGRLGTERALTVERPTPVRF